MNTVWRDALALLVWPGLLSGALLGWFYMWLTRKLTARLQGRQGPPFYQPFFDFIKLLGKENVVSPVTGKIYRLLPWISLASAVFALSLVPAPGNLAKSFNGDLIVFLYLMEMPALCEVLAGYASRSPYAQLSAAREAIMSLAYNLPFLAAMIALAIHAHSFSLDGVARMPLNWSHLVVAAAFLMALPARLKINPFSIPNAEQELVAGVHTEYSGRLLGIFELSHGIEVVAIIGMFAAIFVTPLASGLLGWILYLALSLLLVIVITITGAATARLKLNQAFKFYWSWGAAATILVLIAAVI